MQAYRVQIWPKGSPPKASTVVEAESEKAAAEQLYGKPLLEEGMLHQLRAIVRRIDRPRETISLYEIYR
jgi:hypothetical protein